jgi:molybdopterin synthase sulfur carrier subunit
VIRLEFAPALQRHAPAPPMSLPDGRLRDVLRQALDRVPALRGYVLDDQGNVRKHVAVFVNDELQRDRASLARDLRDGDRVYVVQALSGG